MLKALKNKNVIISSSGLILSLIGVLIYIILPFSELANGIEYSGDEALKVLMASPALVFIGGVFFIIALLGDIKNWKNTFSDVAIYAAVIAMIFTVIFNFSASLSYYLTLNSLGFVAPFTGLKYEVFAYIMPVFLFWQLIFTVLFAAESIRDKSK